MGRAPSKTYKRLSLRPAVRDLTLEEIQWQVNEMSEVCEEVGYSLDDDDVIQAAVGDEEDVQEFRMTFLDLSCELQRMRDALDEEWVPECYDLILPAINAGDMYTYEPDNDDWTPIDGILMSWARDEVRTKLKRLTKDELMDACAQSLGVLRLFLGLRYRYDCLSSALETIRGQNRALIDGIKGILDAYEKEDWRKIDILAEELKWNPELWLV